MPEVDLELQLAERQWLATPDVRLDEGCKCRELVTLDIDLENVDVGMTVHPHQSLQGVHRWVVGGSMGIDSAETVSLEVCAMQHVFWDLGAE